MGCASFPSTAVARPPSQGSRQRNNLERRSRESPARARDPHHRRHRLPRQGGAHDAARPVSRGGQAPCPGAASRRRHRRRPVLREGRVVSTFPPLARAPRRRIRRVPSGKMRPAGRRRDRSAARPLDPAARVPFSADAELKDVAALVARLRAQADDTALAAQFRADAVKRLEEEGRDPADERALRLAAGRERKLWLSQQLVQAGMDRARAWGWPNTYTYTKAMGEQAIAASGCKYALVRPAIVESALRFPFPGWNEGFTTSAPLVFMGLKGQRVFPAGYKRVLDLIPVDLVAAGILGVAGAACAGRLHHRVFQLASGDVNPFYVRRSVELVALYKRRKMEERVAEGKRSAFENWIDTFLEPYPASKELYFLSSTPFFRAAAKGMRKLIADHGASWGAPRTTALLARADQALESVDRQLAMLETTWDLFLPFIAGERFIFQCKHTRQLWARLRAADREKLPWDPEAIDWRTYWMEVHMRGLEEWVFPGLEEESKALKREVAQPKDLLALLAASRNAFGQRVALRFYAGEDSAAELARTRDDRITY